MNKNVFREDLNLFGLEFNIAWYAVIICLGIVAGMFIAYLLAKKRGYKYDVIIDFLIIALPLAVICARLYYVFSEWSYYSRDLSKIIAVWEGGLAIYGAVIGAVIAAVIFCKWKKVPIGDILDFGGIGLIIGQAIGRWGNFVNQEAFGEPVTELSQQWFPYAVHIDGRHSAVMAENGVLVNLDPCPFEWHQATFFYESMWNLLVFGFLVYFAWKLCKRRGNVFAWYLLLYGAGRSWIEGLRTDSLWLIPGVVRISQALAIVLVILSAIYLWKMRGKEPLPAYQGPYTIGYVPEQESEAPAEEAAEENGEETAEAEADAEDEKEGKQNES